MNLVDAIARLERAGEENSRQWQKLREAIDQSADLLAKIFPGGGYVTHLPSGYTFVHWQSKEYQLKKMDGSKELFCLTRDHKDVISMVAFSKEIHAGLLDEIRQCLENNSAFLESTTAKLTRLT